ncbi:unnamed protein product, partial [Adineta steineri]
MNEFSLQRLCFKLINNAAKQQEQQRIACEFAGDIHSPNDLWHVLKEGCDIGSAIPSDRFDL